MSYTHGLEATSIYKRLPSLAFPEDLSLPHLMAAEKEVTMADPTADMLQTGVSIKIDAAQLLARQGQQSLAEELLDIGAETALTCERLIDDTYVDTIDFVRDHCYNGILRNSLHYYRQPGALTEGRTADTRVQANAYETVTREIVLPLTSMDMPDDLRLRGAMATQRNKLLVIQLLNRLQAYAPTNTWAVVGANKREQHYDLLPNGNRQSNGFNLKIMLDGGDFVPLIVRGRARDPYETTTAAADKHIGMVFASEICAGAETWSTLRAIRSECSGVRLFSDQAELIRVATSRLMDHLVSLEPVQKSAPDTERSQRGLAAFGRMLEQGLEAAR